MRMTSERVTHVIVISTLSVDLDFDTAFASVRRTRQLWGRGGVYLPLSLSSIEHTFAGSQAKLRFVFLTPYQE
jgi:hypothetical protein